MHPASIALRAVRAEPASEEVFECQVAQHAKAIDARQGVSCQHRSSSVIRRDLVGEVFRLDRQHDIIGQLFSRDMPGLLAFTRVTGALIQNIRRVNKPVVAAIQGAAVGAGSRPGAADPSQRRLRSMQ